MLILTAEGPSAGEKASWEIPAESVAMLGRHQKCECCVTWDSSISRSHAEIRVIDSAINIRCLPGSGHPVWRDGQSYFEVQLNAGDSCRIGRTWFNVTSSSSPLPVVDIISQSETAEHTTSMLMSPADIRLAVVSENATSLWKTTTEKQLAESALQILHQVLNFAELLVVLSCEDLESARRPKIIHWHKKVNGARESVSRELIAQAMRGGETAVQVESDALGGAVKSGRWSFCVPIKSDSAIPWCIYVGGKFGDFEDYGPFLTPQKLASDAGVTQLVAHLTGAVRSVRVLETRFEGVSQFFSPRLLETVANQTSDNADLAPQETDIVAIYCDLRGFSRMVSTGIDDLQALLNRISSALGVMTRSIIEQDGVIADFQGDSALGFWGWPVALTDGPIPACRAALQIGRIFRMAAAARDVELSGCQVGIGIASGRAIAGRIGTRDHAKIGVFGPVVNVASRLEGLTKQIGASILIDEETAMAVQSALGPEEGRCRPMGNIQPAGFDKPINVWELLGPENESSISNADVENFIDALAAFQNGHWDKARKFLSLLPVDDRARDFLLLQIAANGYQPPHDWSGTISMTAK